MAKSKSEPLPDIAVVLCHFNPCRYQRPIENAHATIVRLVELGIPYHLTTCEFPGEDQTKGQLGSNDHLISRSILWQKEALLNAAVSRLPDHITKVVILDADVLIPDAAWLGQVSELLEECAIIQPWSRVAFLDESGKEKACMASVGKGFARKDPRAANFNVYHPGFAWAAKRTLWTEGPGLYENCIVGSGDELLATAVTGTELPDKGESVEDHAAKQAWVDAFRKWNSGGNFGFLRADIKTLWHGEYKNRQYKARHLILADFDPATDLKPKTTPGPVEWSDHARTYKPELLQAVADYFGQRLEDSAFIKPPAPKPDPVPVDPNWPPPPEPEPEPATLDTPQEP